MHDNYANFYITRMQGSQYLMYTGYMGNYCVDMNTLKANKHLEGYCKLINIFIEGKYMLVVNFRDPITILRDLQMIGEIEFSPKSEICKNDQRIRGRYEQQRR